MKKLMYVVKVLDKPTRWFYFLLLFWFCTCCSCESPTNSGNNSDNKNNEMIVSRRHGSNLAYVNQNTFEITKTVNINIPDSLQIYSKIFSTNKDYLICIGMTSKEPFNSYTIIYDTKHDSVYNIFPIGLDSVGAPRIIAANLKEDPGLFYLYSHNVGLYSIDFFDEVIEKKSSEIEVGKEFIYSIDKTKLAILKDVPGGLQYGYSEIEIYNTASRLDYNELILNKNKVNSIQIDDLIFSENNKEIFISIRLPEMRNIENYIGSYDLETKKLFKSSITLPWSINPYYLAYSSKRKEVYTVGRDDKCYIIDISEKDYKIKSIINLTGKVPSPSRIIVREDQNVAFVSCVYSNLVFAIDLENRSILKSIEIETPYLMLQL